jgi:uncharacterized protein involved in exopolysaccharide biosynthesis
MWRHAPGCHAHPPVQGQARSVQVDAAQQRTAVAEAELARAQDKFNTDAATHESMQQSTLTAEVAALRDALTEARSGVAALEDDLHGCRAQLSLRVWRLIFSVVLYHAHVHDVPSGKASW